MFMIVAITNKAKKVCELSLLFVLFMWIFFYILFFFFLSNIHMNSALFRHFHMNSEICFPFFAILFRFYFFLHYLHEESFSFLHCFYYCVTIHMNSEPFFYHPYYFFLIITTHVTIQVNSAPFFNIFSLFTWSMQFSELFTWMAIFFLFFFLQLFCTIHTNNLFLLKKIQHYSHSWTNSSNNNLACCMYIVTKASPYRKSWKDPWSCIMWEFDGETRAFLRVRQTQEEVWHSTIRCTTSMERGE